MKRRLSYFIIFLLFCSAVIPQEKETLYKYNTANRKYHLSECRWAKKCPKNCIDLSLKEIKERSGIPCKVCKPPKD